MSRLYNMIRNKVNTRVMVLVMLSLAFVGFSCMQQKTAQNPEGYNLSSPQKFTLPSSLTEISGHTFYKGDPDVVYAQEDENGRVYHFKLGDKKVSHTKFAGHGDYEDIAISREQVVMLRSDGVLFVFPFSQLKANNITSVKTFDNLLPKGEYEGMYADDKTGDI